MNDFYDELAKEELSGDELRQVLQRLAREELGGSDLPTIGSVSEATGANGETIGRILANLRGAEWEAWRTRFESTAREHKQRLEALEAKPKSAAEMTDDELYERVRRVNFEKQGIYGFVIALILGPAMIIGFMIALNRPKHPSTSWYPGKTIQVNGKTFGYDGQCNWSQARADGTPGPVVDTYNGEKAEDELILRGGGGCP